MRTIVAVLAVLMLTACQASRPPMLVYAAGDRSVDWGELPDLDLYQIDPQTQWIQRLTDTPGLIETDPCLSPARDRLAYATYEQVQTEPGLFQSLLIVKDLDDPDPASVRAIYASDRGVIFTPVWSNNGQRIVFVELVAGRFMLKRINADGTGLTELGYGSDPSWRIDDRAIFFNSRDTPEGPADELMVRELSSGVVKSLALRGDGFNNLQRGTSIVYTAEPYSRRNQAVWLIDANSIQTRLSDPGKTHRDADPVHLNGTALVAFTRVDVKTNQAAIYVVDRTADDPVAVPLVQGQSWAYTRGGELLLKQWDSQPVPGHP